MADKYRYCSQIFSNFRQILQQSKSLKTLQSNQNQGGMHTMSSHRHTNRGNGVNEICEKDKNMFRLSLAMCGPDSPQGFEVYTEIQTSISFDRQKWILINKFIILLWINDIITLCLALAIVEYLMS
ncbi:unnamed protein product [Nezara viridula]|uniref:Uncharacterized protein n=1 Tax=Nezara viridula TaxID=85310 RepID=A0A9P0MMR4_NEZVI|nr:unnamed protein product [Nezara viridula]